MGLESQVPGAQSVTQNGSFLIESGMCNLQIQPEVPSLGNVIECLPSTGCRGYSSERDKLDLALACLTSVLLLPVGKPYTKSIYDQNAALGA